MYWWESGMTILAVKGQEKLQGEPDLHLEESCRKVFETSASGLRSC